MKLYKLTDQDGYTRRGQTGETQWTAGMTITKPRKNNPQLCSNDVVHATRGLELALLLNPNQAAISNPQPWEAEGEPVVYDYGKVGCLELTTVKKLPVPAWFLDSTITRRVRVRFAILCARTVLPVFEAKYPQDKRAGAAIEAAERWLDGRASSSELRDAAAYAAYAAYAAAAAAAYAAAAAAADAYAYAAAAAAASRAKKSEIDFAALAKQAVAAEEGNPL